MRKIAVWLAAFLIFLSSAGYSSASTNLNSNYQQSHWVNKELAAFKQAFIPVLYDSAGGMAEADRKVLQEDIFNAEGLPGPAHSGGEVE